MVHHFIVHFLSVPNMSRELTKTLLLHDFAIPNWNIPIDRLCPPVRSLRCNNHPLIKPIIDPKSPQLPALD